mgnify:CR=1 FL=1
MLGYVSGDWNDDGGMDSAILVSPDNEDEDAGLYIYLEEDNNAQFEIFKPNLAWSGMLWGTKPSLGLTASGSLQVLSQNQAIGRNRWSQKLTIAYRNKHFIVAGYTYEAYDTLEPETGEISCDVNLLTGKGVRDGKSFKTKKMKIKLADWTHESAPKQCHE